MLGWGVIKAFLSIKKWTMFTVSLFIYKTRSERWFCLKPIFGPYPGPFPISKSAANHRKLKFRFPYISSEIFSHTSFSKFYGPRNPNITSGFAQKNFLLKFSNFQSLQRKVVQSSEKWKKIVEIFFGQKLMRCSDFSSQKRRK